MRWFRYLYLMLRKDIKKFNTKTLNFINDRRISVEIVRSSDLRAVFHSESFISHTVYNFASLTFLGRCFTDSYAAMHLIS